MVPIGGATRAHDLTAGAASHSLSRALSAGGTTSSFAGALARVAVFATRAKAPAKLEVVPPAESALLNNLQLCGGFSSGSSFRFARGLGRFRSENCYPS